MKMTMIIFKNILLVLLNHYGLNKTCANGQKNHVILIHMNIGSVNKKKTGQDVHLYFKLM